MDCSYTTPLHNICICFVSVHEQLRNNVVLYPVIHMLLTTSVYVNLISFLWPDLLSISKICSSIHHIGVYLLIICSFGLCEYPCVTSYDRMLLVGKHEHLYTSWSCTISHGFFSLTRPIYFTGLSDGVSVYVYGQYAYLFFRYLEPHVYLSI